MMNAKALLLFLLLGLTACSGLWLGPDPQANDPGALYDTFWQTFDRNYVGFQVRGVNWQAVYDTYRPQVTAITSNAQLLDIMGRSIRTLRDGHVFVQAKGVGTVGSFTFVTNQDFVGLAQIKSRYVPDLTAINSNIAYAEIRPGVEYIYIGTFGNNPGFAKLDGVLEQMKNYRALIIDIRDNGGGNDANGQAIAERFTTERRLYGYLQYRTGPAHVDLSPLDPVYLNPTGTGFTKPIYLLTNRYVFSAANGFTLMMRSLPNVVQLGDTTGNGIAGAIPRELPNGWTCGVVSKLESMPDGYVVEGRGIPPARLVLNEPPSQSGGRDHILETALELIDP